MCQELHCEWCEFEHEVDDIGNLSTPKPEKKIICVEELLLEVWIYSLTGWMAIQL